jgi:GNAT superfamily N-acetyltransferase
VSSSASPGTTVVVAPEPAASAADPETVDAIADLVNRVYVIAEAGLWTDGAERTTSAEVADLLAKGWIATARVGDRVVGAVTLRALDTRTAEFGMLAADPEWRGVGVGRELVAFAERWAAERGHSTMQLELLVPTGWSHPSKQFLRGWYERLGYREFRRTRLEELYPELEPQLATPCDLLVFRKPLPAAPLPDRPPVE